MYPYLIYQTTEYMPNVFHSPPQIKSSFCMTLFVGVFRFKTPPAVDWEIPFQMWYSEMSFLQLWGVPLHLICFLSENVIFNFLFAISCAYCGCDRRPYLDFATRTNAVLMQEGCKLQISSKLDGRVFAVIMLTLCALWIRPEFFCIKFFQLLCFQVCPSIVIKKCLN